MSSVRGA